MVKSKSTKTKRPKATVSKNVNNKGVLAKSKDGTIQITYTVDKAVVKKELRKTAEELSKTIEIKGFRKGKAPIEKVLESVDRSTILQTTLNRIVPKMLDNSFREYKLTSRAMMNQSDERSKSLILSGSN